jgi:hypothetical protein
MNLREQADRVTHHKTLLLAMIPDGAKTASVIGMAQYAAEQLALRDKQLDDTESELSWRKYPDTQGKY